MVGSNSADLWNENIEIVLNEKYGTLSKQIEVFRISKDNWLRSFTYIVEIDVFLNGGPPR